jgi:hypothetical protein
MECPVCYTSKAKYKLVCDHSFCYQCIIRWYQECENHTCPLCRHDINFVGTDDTREVHVQCYPHSKIDDYLKFQHLLDKYAHLDIKDIEYLKRQPWVEYLTEHRVKNQVYTKYVFYGLQGTQEASHKKRQKEPEAGILSKAYKD